MAEAAILATSTGIRWYPVILVHLIFIVNNLGFFISVAPQTQLYEDIVCRSYHSSGSLPTTLFSRDDHCKDPTVQAKVAELFGFQALFDGIPGLVLAVPYGIAADRLGRKPVLVMSIAGVTLSSAWGAFVCWNSLPIKLVWLSSAFTVLGGGSTVAVAVCMMIIADAASEKDRSKLFFSLQASFIVAEMVGPALGSVLMQKSIWTPILLGVLCTALSTGLAAIAPETLDLHARRKSCVEHPMTCDGTERMASSPVGVWARHCLDTVRFIIQDINVAFLVLAFLIADFARQSMSLLLQYVSERYHWPLAKASFLLSFRAGAQLVLFLLIFPALDLYLLNRRGWSAQTKDLHLSSLSLWLLSTSFVAFAFAPTIDFIVLGLVLYTIGSGFNTFARSLVSALVEPARIGTLYTTLSVMDTTGSLLAGPLVARAFKWAMQLGGIWHGLPYMLSLVLCTTGAFMVSRIRLSQQPTDSHGGEYAPLAQEVDQSDLERRLEE